MNLPPQKSTVIEAAARVIRDLANQPFQLPQEAEDIDSDTIYVEPLETAIEHNRPALYPAEGYISDSLRFLRGCTIWAIDGGILTWQFANGLLLVGRAVISKMNFSGTETVQKVFDVPIVPFVLYPPLQGNSSSSINVESVSEEYLQFILGKIPEPPSTIRLARTTEYFSDTDEFLKTLPDSYYAASGVARASLTQYIDQLRDTAELIAFMYALKQADARHIILRDGRIHGGAGFLTRMVRKDKQSNTGLEIVREFTKTLANAVDRGVRVLGIIKHPRSNYCTNYYNSIGVEFVSNASSDALLFYREIEPPLTERQHYVYGAGKRSCMWRIKERYSNDSPVDLNTDNGRHLVHWFYQNTGCFFLKPKEGVLPIRVDFITHNNHYRSWLADNLVEQIYALCTGSGSPLGLPQPITIADSYAKVHKPELTRKVDGLIAQFETSSDLEDQKIGRELRAYLDIYYRGVIS